MLTSSNHMNFVLPPVHAHCICKYYWCPAVKMKNKMFKVDNYAKPFSCHLQHAKFLNLADWEDFYILYTCAPSD